jgi:hypothetical protein
MAEEVPLRCELCGLEVLADVSGHYRFHRDAAIAFLELLNENGRGTEGDSVRARIAVCTRMMGASATRGLAEDKRLRLVPRRD